MSYMWSVYSKTGDCGETSLYSGERVSKCCNRIECIGSIDELQAALGMARSLCCDEGMKSTIHQLESALSQVMAELATVNGEPRIHANDVQAIEQAIDAYQALLPDGFTWRVPGDNQTSAALHVARTIARRCERVFVRCIETGEFSKNTELLAFMNRVSDFCYVCACVIDTGALHSSPGTCDREMA